MREATTTAFAGLRRYSEHHNTKLTTVAAQLTSTGHLPDLDPTIHPGTQPAHPAGPAQHGSTGIAERSRAARRFTP